MNDKQTCFGKINVRASALAIGGFTVGFGTWFITGEMAAVLYRHNPILAGKCAKPRARALFSPSVEFDDFRDKSPNLDIRFNAQNELTIVVAQPDEVLSRGF